MIINKTQFLKGLKCSRFLYLDLFHQELSDTEGSSNTSKPNHGNEVEAAVYKQYFDGINVYDATKSAHELAEITIDAIKSGVPIIYQPTFMSKNENFIFRGDLLVKGQNNYRLIEVKSSTEIKIPAHIFDVGFQKMILDSHHENNITDDNVTYTYNYKSRKYKDPIFRNIEVFIAHINKEYVFDGILDLDSLIIEENVTARANRNLALINRTLRTFESAIKKNKIPELNIGTHCTKPEKCTFYNYCWKDVPKKSIHRASKLSEAKIRKLAEKGITSIEDIPSNFEMSESVRTQIAAELGEKEVVKKSKLKSFLEKLKNKPLIFLDFESIMPAVPVFIGTKPYQQICFQYSLIKLKEIESSDLIRHDFLAEAGYDPRRTFIEALLHDTKGEEKIIVYNMAFESTRLKELAEQFPDLSKEIQNRIDRIVDLMVPFRERQYYHRDFQGKYSIKVVAPIMSPEISYDNLVIQNGSSAMHAFAQLHKLKIEEQYRIRKALLDYCYTDVLSMVFILRNLFSKIS